MFFKKWLTRKNRPHIENKGNDLGKITSYFEEGVIDQAKNNPYIEDMWINQEKIHYFGEKQAGQERIILHFADDLTGRRKTFSVPVDYSVRDLQEQIIESGVLPYTAWFSPDLEYDGRILTENTIRELKEYVWRVNSTKIKDTHLRDGDTLHIEYEDAELIRRWGVVDHFLAEYEVIVRWKCFEEALTGNCRIMCHGCDSCRDIEDKLSSMIEIDDKHFAFTISASSWPRHHKFLCQLSKNKRVILFAEAYERYADSVMYGCPTAGIFKDADKQQSCSVEIVRYE